MRFFMANNLTEYFQSSSLPRSTVTGGLSTPRAEIEERLTVIDRYTNHVKNSSRRNSMCTFK